MSVEIPPPIIARRFIRNSREKARAYADAINLVLGKAAAAHRLGGAQLLATYRPLIRSAGEILEANQAFGMQSSQNATRKTVSGNILRAFGLGQGAFNAEETYLEHAAMIMHVEAWARSKQFAYSEACTGIAISQHTLQRIAERLVVPEIEFAALLGQELPSAIENLALADNFGIAAFQADDPLLTRSIAIPCLNGLLYFRLRLISSMKKDTQMGIKMVSTEPRSVRPYLDRRRLLSHAAGLPPDDDSIVLATWCTTTYLNLADLSAAQRRYKEAFLGFAALVEPAARKIVASRYLDPEAPRDDVALTSNAKDALDAARDAIGGGWLKAEPRYAISFLMPAKSTAADFERSFTEAVEEAGLA